MAKKTVTMFDWNGNLREDAKRDEKEFGIALNYVEGSDLKGFSTFEIDGDAGNIARFLEYYELELDDVEG